jgi:hypothetical protein
MGGNIGFGKIGVEPTPGSEEPGLGLGLGLKGGSFDPGPFGKIC